jgi:hypothetical protein
MLACTCAIRAAAAGSCATTGAWRPWSQHSAPAARRTRTQPRKPSSSSWSCVCSCGAKCIGCGRLSLICTTDSWLCRCTWATRMKAARVARRVRAGALERQARACSRVAAAVTAEDLAARAAGLASFNARTREQHSKLIRRLGEMADTGAPARRMPPHRTPLTCLCRPRVRRAALALSPAGRVLSGVQPPVRMGGDAAFSCSLRAGAARTWTTFPARCRCCLGPAGATTRWSASRRRVRTARVRGPRIDSPPPPSLARAQSVLPGCSAPMQPPRPRRS